MEKEYCYKCKQENNPDNPVCKCGGQDFVWGDDISIKDDKVICKCGNHEFIWGIHIDFESYSNTSYKCSKCGNVITTQIHKK